MNEGENRASVQGPSLPLRPAMGPAVFGISPKICTSDKNRIDAILKEMKKCTYSWALLRGKVQSNSWRVQKISNLKWMSHMNSPKEGIGIKGGSIILQILADRRSRVKVKDCGRPLYRFIDFTSEGPLKCNCALAHSLGTELSVPILWTQFNLGMVFQ